MSRREDLYKPALQGKNIPVLTLDYKWHQLFTQVESTKEIRALEAEINELLKRQGKVNTEVKDIRRIKKKLMEEIVEKADRASTGKDKAAIKKLDDDKRLMKECNKKLDSHRDEIVEIPKKIHELNEQLMLLTMEECYNRMKDNRIEIEEITEWVTEIRVELKKRLIRKQEKEIMNQALYAYMHDIFGVEVMELFDIINKKSDVDGE